MKAVLISINPIWCELIAAGKKTIEVRKNMPKLETPFKVYIYCTKDKKGWFDFGKKQRLDGMVIGEFVCNEIQPFDVPYPAFMRGMDKDILERSCLTYWQLHRYAYHDCLYGWGITNLVIYDKPKGLSEFTGLRNTKFGYEPVKITRPPQSWYYVEQLDWLYETPFLLY